VSRKLIFFFVLALFFSGGVSVFALETENVIWQIKPREGNYMKYFGKRVVDVNRAEADRLIPQEFGWQGNQLIFIFHLTSKQLQNPTFEFIFEIFSYSYDADEPVHLDIYAGKNINNLKTAAQGIKITRAGTYTVQIPSSHFYLGNQNFIKIMGENVRPIGYGENPPNCRFLSFRLAIPAGQAEQKQEETVTAEPSAPPAEGQKQDESAPEYQKPFEEKYEEEKALQTEENAAMQDEMMGY